MRISNAVSSVIASLIALVPMSAVVVGCAISTQDDSSSQSDPLALPGGVVNRRIFPSAPAYNAVKPFPSSVTVQWVSPDSSMTQFVVYRRDASWVWQPVHTETNTPGKSYAWVDTDRSLSAQCYMVTAVNSMGLGTSGPEQCTVRPDPSVFPQSAPSAATAWYGLSPQNDGVAPLESGDLFLQLENQTWGVNLGLGHSTGNNVKAERQGGGSSWPLMVGEAIAIRVWGAGWLKYGNQTWGVDLTLSDTPSYEWYVVGGTPGQNLNSGEFALYNKNANDFLVRGGQTWGVSLNWYKKTLPSSGGGGGNTQSGVKTLVLYNCHSDSNPVEMWVEDVTARTGFVDKGRLDEEWMDGSCPAIGSPWTFTPTSGHSYVVRAIDFTASGCDNSPNISGCARKEMSFVGDANGQTFVDSVN